MCKNHYDFFRNDFFRNAKLILYFDTGKQDLRPIEKNGMHSKYYIEFLEFIPDSHADR